MNTKCASTKLRYPNPRYSNIGAKLASSSVYKGLKTAQTHNLRPRLKRLRSEGKLSTYKANKKLKESICMDKFIPKLGVFKSRVQCPLEEVNELMKVDQVLEFMAFVGPGISKIAKADV
ncbi:hypothetical protein ACET3Z_027674 [Daucus carota]